MAWHEMTFTGSHVLTASDMNRVQENFTALAQGHSGAPALAVNSFVASGVASLGTLHVSSAMFYGGTPLVPPGAVIPFAGATAPAGWLLCDGSPVSRSGYSDLYAVVGDTFGAGDGSTTFNLPDLRGRAVVALDSLGGSSANRVTAAWADSLGGSGGEETHALSASEMPVHNHGIHDPGHTHEVPSRNAAGSGNAASEISGADDSFSTESKVTGITIDNAGGSGGVTQSHNNLQPSLALSYLIKT